MKARSTAVQGGLAALGLLVAFITWQRPRETVSIEKVMVVDATKKTLERVRFDDGTKFVELKPDSDGYLLTHGYLDGKAPVFDAGTPEETDDVGNVDGGKGKADAGAPMVAHQTPPPPPPPVRTVRASDRAKDLYAKLAPFEATRALGILKDEKLKEVGLSDSPRTLQLTVSGTARTFAVAKPATGQFGWYLRDQVSGQVYLLEGSTLADLDPTASVLVDRRLHTFKLSEFDAITVTVDGASITLNHSAPDNIASTVRLTRQESPDAPDELIKNWHEKVFSRLIVTEVLGQGEVPKNGEPKVGLKVEYFSKGAKKGWVEVAFDDTKGTWARSENTTGWMAIHQGSEDLVLEAQRFIKDGGKK